MSERVRAADGAQGSALPDAGTNNASGRVATSGTGFNIPRGVIACPFCASTRFRRSRLQTADYLELLMLRLPVRCMRCSQRRYVTLLTAGLAISAQGHGERISKGDETWRAWTGQTTGEAHHRPMSTAMGTEAMNLRGHPDAKNITVDPEKTPS